MDGNPLAPEAMRAPRDCGLKKERQGRLCNVLWCADLHTSLRLFVTPRNTPPVQVIPPLCSRKICEPLLLPALRREVLQDLEEAAPGGGTPHVKGTLQGRQHGGDV
jgi:hypothetical protein